MAGLLSFSVFGRCGMENIRGNTSDNDVLHGSSANRVLVVPLSGVAGQRGAWSDMLIDACTAGLPGPG